MTLREDLKQCRARVASLTAQVADKDAQIASLQSDLSTANATIADLRQDKATLTKALDDANARIAQLEADLAACQGDGSGTTIKPGTSIQNAINDLQPGGLLTLDGAFKSTSSIAVNKNGMTLQAGPNGASIEFAGVQDGVRCKKANADFSWVDATIKNLQVFGATRSGLVLGRNTRVIGGRYHHNGEIGISGNGDGVRGINASVFGAELDNNGSAANLGHGSSGSKIFEFDGCTYEDCDIHHNVGNGQWSDHDSANVTVKNCRVHDNTRRGIFWEKCGRRTDPYKNTKPYNVVYEGPLLVDGCVLTNNGTEAGSYQQIGGAACVNLIVKNTTFADGNGIAIDIWNDPNRMPPIAGAPGATEPGWFVEGCEVWDSTNTYNGERVVVRGQPAPPAGAVVRK